jgi:hypothetical protein
LTISLLLSQKNCNQWVLEGKYFWTLTVTVGAAADTPSVAPAI